MYTNNSFATYIKVSIAKAGYCSAPDILISRLIQYRYVSSLKKYEIVPPKKDTEKEETQ